MEKKVLIADDDESILWILQRMFKDKKIETVEARDGKSALEMLKHEDISIAIMDIRMPEKDGLDVLREIKEAGCHIPIIIMTAQGTMKNAVEAMKRGAFDYITKPFDIGELEILIDKALEHKKLRQEVADLKDRLKERVAKEITFIGKSRAVQNVFKTIGMVAQKDVSVIIQGESGTGKEIVAKLIHINSARNQGPFIAVNSAAIPKELMESELFGYEKGAFTGAVETRLGKFELANNGTLFLDEIGDMPLDLQSKLLRAIQGQEFYRVGGKQPIKVDVRIVAATHQDMEKAIEEKRFREDLLYRLNVVTIKLPPLRNRKEDISLLADYFLHRFQEDMGIEPRTLSSNALTALKAYSWPGNVRELENILRRAVILSQNPMLSPDDLSLPQKKQNKESLEDIISNRLEGFINDIDARGKHDLYDTIVPFMERPLIRLVLKKTGGNQVKAAELLGINRNTLRKKIKELGIKVEDFS
ncbi:MAG: nitrogen regulation protein NR(I) [Deltaproteobacteria bacterium]|nr:nitrogen regulation protein NR(I) [Deltaproteobacteria bacterium]